MFIIPANTNFDLKVKGMDEGRCVVILTTASAEVVICVGETTPFRIHLHPVLCIY